MYHKLLNSKWKCVYLHLFLFLLLYCCEEKLLGTGASMNSYRKFTSAEGGIKITNFRMSKNTLNVFAREVSTGYFRMELTTSITKLAIAVLVEFARNIWSGHFQCFLSSEISATRNLSHASVKTTIVKIKFSNSQWFSEHRQQFIANP